MTSTNDNSGTVAIVLVSSGIFFILGLIIGASLTTAHWQRDSIRYGHGEYSQKTGQWQWKAVEEPAPATSELRAESGLRPIRR